MEFSHAFEGTDKRRMREDADRGGEAGAGVRLLAIGALWIGLSDEYCVGRLVIRFLIVTQIIPAEVDLVFVKITSTK